MSEPKDLSYEAARAKLEEIVTKLESPNCPLTDAMKLWEEGEQLAKYCQSWLNEAKAKVAQAQLGEKD